MNNTNDFITKNFKNLDLRELLVGILGSNIKLHDTIDKIYEEKKVN